MGNWLFYHDSDGIGDDMRGICKLCGSEAILKESHFIPKFVGKWVKKTSVTGFIRDKDQIDKRAQDIAKEYWLCGDCEELFSKWERAFANKVFYPFVNEEKCEANYDYWMSKFCASVTWRTLSFTRSRNSRADKTDEYNKAVDNAELHLRNYLLGIEPNLNQYEQHVFPLDPIETTTETEFPPNINRYFLRTMAMDIVGNSTDIYIYTKLPKFIILGVVKAKELNKLRSSRISLGTGKIGPRDYWWPDGFVNYLCDKAEEISRVHRSMPAEHLARIEEFVQNNPEKANKSKLIEAMMHDYEMFGDKIFR